MLCAVCGLELPIPNTTIKFYEGRKARVIRYPILNPIFAITPSPSREDPPIHITKEILNFQGYWIHDDCLRSALRGSMRYVMIVEEV